MISLGGSSYRGPIVCGRGPRSTECKIQGLFLKEHKINQKHDQFCTEDIPERKMFRKRARWERLSKFNYPTQCLHECFTHNLASLLCKRQPRESQLQGCSSTRRIYSTHSVPRYWGKHKCTSYLAFFSDGCYIHYLSYFSIWDTY